MSTSNLIALRGSHLVEVVKPRRLIDGHIKKTQLRIPQAGLTALGFISERLMCGQAPEIGNKRSLCKTHANRRATSQDKQVLKSIPVARTAAVRLVPRFRHIKAY